MSSSAPAKESKLEFAGYLLVGACKLLIEAVERVENAAGKVLEAGMTHEPTMSPVTIEALDGSLFSLRSLHVDPEGCCEPNGIR